MSSQAHRPTNNVVPLFLLPPVLQEIARATSVDAALRLAEGHGGTTIFLPRNVAAKHPVSITIGQDAANAVSRMMFDRGLGDGVGHLDIPRAAAAIRFQRDAAIRAAVLAGESKQQVALRFNTTTRHVRRICNSKGP